MGAVHIMNNTHHPLLIPLSGGVGEGKVGRMVKLLAGWNSTTPEVLRLISGGVNDKGQAKGGTAGAYFDKRHLQVGEPLDGQPVHKVPEIRGLRRSDRTKRRRGEQDRIAQLESMVTALMAERSGVVETDHLDPRSMNLDDLEIEILDLDGAALTGVLALEFKRPGGARKGAIELLTAAMKA